MAGLSEAERDRSVIDQLERHELPVEWRAELPEVDGDSVLLMAWLDGLARQSHALHVEVVRAEGVNSTEAMILYHLVLGGPPYRQSPTRINRMLELTSGGVTKAIDRLETQGYVRRQPDPEDGRSIQIVLTEAGRDTGRRIAETFSRRYEVIFSPLSDSERREAIPILRRLLDCYGAKLG